MANKITNDGTKGGLLKGKSHDEGGVKAIVVDANNKPVELEKDEVIITKKAVADTKERTLTGTNAEILSKINQSGGGVPIVAPSYVEKDKMLYGGNIEYFKSAIDDSGYSFKLSMPTLLVSYQKQSSFPLRMLVKHDKLFEKFPELKNVKVNFGNITSDEVYAESEVVHSEKGVAFSEINLNLHFDYYKKHGKEKFDITGASPEYSKEAVLLHEIQHLLQQSAGRFIGRSYDETLGRVKQDAVRWKGDAISEKEIEANAYLLYKYQYAEQEAMLTVFYWLRDKGIEYGNARFIDWSEHNERSQSESQKGIMKQGGKVPRNLTYLGEVGGANDGGIIPPIGELKNANNYKLNYVKNGKTFEFHIYKPITSEVGGYNKINYSCTTKDCSLKMEYNQFVNYLYTEGYIDDVKNFKEGGNVDDDFDWNSMFIQETPAEKQTETDIDTKEIEYQNSKWSKTYAPTRQIAIDKTVKNYVDAKKTYEDWGSRAYKKNNSVVYAGGDDIHGQAYTIGGVNENRRLKTMAGAKMQMDESVEQLKELGLTQSEIDGLLAQKYNDGGAIKGEELQKGIQTIDVFDDNVYDVHFNDGTFSSYNTKQTIDLLKNTINPVGISYIANEKDILKEQKTKRRLQSLAVDSDKVIVINPTKDRMIPFLFVKKSDSENYNIAPFFNDKLDTPRKAFRKELREYFELQKGISTEQEHKETFEKVAEGKIGVEQAIEETAKEHIKENPNYYSELGATITDVTPSFDLPESKYTNPKFITNNYVTVTFGEYEGRKGQVQETVWDKKTNQYYYKIQGVGKPISEEYITIVSKEQVGVDKEIGEIVSYFMSNGASKVTINDLAKTYNESLISECLELYYILKNKDVLTKQMSITDTIAELNENYERQYYFNYSDTQKMMLNQYSTPSIMGYIFSLYLRGCKSVLEPSTGNGGLIYAYETEKVTANEIDKERVRILNYQGYKATSLDSTIMHNTEIKHDGIVSNPPFGKYLGKETDRKVLLSIMFKRFYGFSGNMSDISLDKLMAATSLTQLTKNGRAVFVLAGHAKVNSDGLLTSYTTFFDWLNYTFNVIDVININSFKLYSKMGTVKEVMVVLVNGMKDESERKFTRISEAQIPEISYMEESFLSLAKRVLGAYIKSDKNIKKLSYV